MAVIGTYRAQVVPLYGRLLIVDPSMSGADEADLQQALEAADAEIVGASRWRVAVKAGQDTLAIDVTIQIWDTPPDNAPGDWIGLPTLTIEFPHGVLILENISSGPVPLQPGGVERVELPNGSGGYNVQAWYRGREQSAAVVAELWEADDVGDDTAAVYASLAGVEQYLIQIWRHQPNS